MYLPSHKEEWDRYLLRLKEEWGMHLLSLNHYGFNFLLKIIVYFGPRMPSQDKFHLNYGTVLYVLLKWKQIQNGGIDCYGNVQFI